MNTEDALRDFLVERGYVEPGTPRRDLYRGNWIKYSLWGHMVPLIPIYGFKKSFMHHDVHHLLSGYETDWRGELEIAGWELASGGCGWYVFYWLDRVIFMTVGLLLCPIRTARAFRRGLRHRNTFGLDPEDVLPPRSTPERSQRRARRRTTTP